MLERAIRPSWRGVHGYRSTRFSSSIRHSYTTCARSSARDSMPLTNENGKVSEYSETEIFSNDMAMSTSVEFSKTDATAIENPFKRTAVTRLMAAMESPPSLKKSLSIPSTLKSTSSTSAQMRASKTSMSLDGGGPLCCDDRQAPACSTVKFSARCRSFFRSSFPECRRGSFVTGIQTLGIIRAGKVTAILLCSCSESAWKLAGA